MEVARKFAISVLDIIEDMLDEKDITIPDEDDNQREPDNTARLYGMTYYGLEDNITNLIDNDLVNSLVKEGFGDTDKLLSTISNREDFIPSISDILGETITAEQLERFKNNIK